MVEDQNNLNNTVEANVAAMRRWYEEVWNQRRVETIYELAAPDCLINGVSEDGQILRGLDAFAEVHKRLITAFPDMKLVVEDCFGAGDKVLVRWSGTMHHTGEGLGMEPTGALLKLTCVSVVRFADGKAVESWDEWDKMAMFQQIEAGRVKAASA